MMDDQQKTKAELIQELQSLRQRLDHSSQEDQDQTSRLNASEERFRLAIANAPFPIAIHANGKVLHLSDSWTELSGYTKAEIPTVEDWVAKAYGGKTSYGNTIDNVYGTYQLKNGEKQRNGEWQIVTKSGKKRIWDLSSASLGYHTDGSNMIISMAVDVTEKKHIEEALEESENCFRRLFEKAPIPYQSLNLEGRFIEVNDAWLEMLGYERDEVIGHYFQDFVVEENFVRKNLPRFVAAGEIKLPGTVLRCKDGSHKITHIDGRIGYDEDHQFVQTHCMVSDITASAQLEARLRQSQKMEALGSLAGGIAHDFNNMLAIILGNAELLQAKLAQNSNGQQAHLNAILNAGHRSADLVKQILTFSRKEVVQRDALDMTRIVSDSLQMLRSTIPANIEIRQNLGNCSQKVLANQSQINQVVVNLVTNAFHAMEADGGVLSVRLEETSCRNCAMDTCLNRGDSQCVRLVVEDTGHGIAEEHLEQVFNPFFTTKEVGKGTGLGLAVIYGIVQSHSGVIAVDSTLNQGTRVSICLPIMEEHAEQSGAKLAGSAPARTEPDEKPADKVHHIMIVEDEQSIAELYQVFLSSQGYEVTLCHDGYDGLRVFSDHPDRFDLVLTDQSMPNLTGCQLSQVLLKIRPDLPIIVGTGHSDVISQDNYDSKGIRKFLQKPVSLESLHQAVRECLDLKTTPL